MHLKHLALGLAVVTAAPVAVTTAQADNGIFVPLFTYRTGPFSGSGIPVANGLHDYFTMLNERDGGIGGERLIVQECEDGYDTQKGVQCYDLVKDRNPVVITPYSTGITEQLIPKAAVDKIPILSMAYGLSASADGTNSPGSSIRQTRIGTARRRLSGTLPTSRAVLISSRERRSAWSISTRLTASTHSAVASARQGLRLHTQALSR